MRHLNVLSATCDNTLEEILSNELPNVTLLGSVRFQDNLFSKLKELKSEDKKIDVLLLKENLQGGYKVLEFVKILRETYPDIRIVFIMVSTNEEDVAKLKSYLTLKQVYDIIFDDDFGFEELQIALFRPKSYADIAKETKQISFDEEFNHINDIENFNSKEETQKEEKPADLKINFNHNINYEVPSQKTVAFWSPKGGTGVDTLATLTSVMIAKYTDIEVCLVDFSSTPNMNLFFNIADDKRNLEQLYVKEATGKLYPSTIDNYVINGQETACKISNLYLVPGAIRRINFFQKLLEIEEPSTIRENFENLIKTLKERFTVVILILSPDIYHMPTLAGILKSSQINIVLENDLMCFQNVKRYIDPREGIFNRYKIEREKCKYIMNKYYIKDNCFLEDFRQITELDINIDAYFNLIPEELFTAVKKANPISLIENYPEIKRDMVDVVNTITYMEMTEAPAAQNKNKGFFPSFLRKKK